MKKAILVLMLVLSFIFTGSEVMAINHYAEASLFSESATQVEEFFFSPQDNATYIATVYCVARQRNGTGRAAFTQTALFSMNNGVLTADSVGTQEKITNAGATTWSFSVAIVNNALVIRGTGAAGVTTDWNAHLEGFQVGPY